MSHSRIYLLRRIAQLEDKLLDIIQHTNRCDFNNNGSLTDLVPPYIIDEARQLLGLN